MHFPPMERVLFRLAWVLKIGIGQSKEKEESESVELGLDRWADFPLPLSDPRGGSGIGLFHIDGWVVFGFWPGRNGSISGLLGVIRRSLSVRASEKPGSRNITDCSSLPRTRDGLLFEGLFSIISEVGFSFGWGFWREVS